MFCFNLSVEAQQNIDNISIRVTFDSPPTSVTVIKAPLKYNKTFAFSFQIDDGTMDLFSKVFPTFNNLKYTDGCGNDRVFTASSSLFCFFQPNENGPDMHDPLDPSYSDNYLTWEFIEDLYNINYGIYNHGINDNDGTNTSFMDYSIKRNRSYVRRKMYAVTNGGIISNVFATPSQIFEWTQPAFDNGYRLALNKENNGPVGDNGGDVNSSSVNWTNSQYIKRQQAHTVEPVLDYVSALYSQSVDGANYWGSLFTHNINSSQYPQAVFDSDFANIANFYGKDGLDNILLATDEEIYDYLNIRDAVILNQNLNGNVLTITFSGSVPTNLRHYAMSLVVDTAGVKITSITVDGSMGFSRNINTGLINFKWDDQIVPDPEFLAESFTAVAETSGEQRDAWIAMDYVYTIPLGEKKVELVNRLCGLDGLEFDEGFCDITIDTIVQIFGDTIYCIGDTVRLTATAGMDFYEWSDGQSTQTLTVIGQTETKEYWVKGTLNNNTTQDQVTVVINHIPNIVSHSQTNITHIPGTNDTLWVSTEDETLTYLWNTGGVDSNLVVNPEFTTSYYVDVSNESACITRQNFEVIVEETFQFIFDSVCFGGTTQLLNTSSYPDSIVSVLWDLDSDGVFDDAVGDEVEYQFTEYGNHLVGMRSVLFGGGIEVVFNVVPVGDFPIVNFLHDNSCLPGATTFDDFSTIIVGENKSWNWDFGDGGTDVGSFVSHTYSNSRTYDVKLVVTSSIGCKDSIIKQVSIGESPEFDIINANGDILNEWDTTVVNKNDSLYVTIENASLYDSIIWDNSVRDTEYYVTEEGRFSVEVFDKTCSNTKLGNMSFDDGGGGDPTTNEIMSLFTPNGDGYNDVWAVNDPNLISPFSVSVYNRYGNLVYSSDNYNNDWLGDYNDTDLPQATYYYIIEDADGQIFKGPITILR